jgi:ferredoxin
MARAPTIDLSRCTLCEACLEACPEVFVLNPAGYVEIAEHSRYPEECIEEAIRYCPAECISWEGYSENSVA